MTKKSQPNVIVFFTDQQRWDTTGLHGNPLELTPNFDRIGKAGTHVFNSFTCHPVCGPARACLQTGMYGTTTGCFKNCVPLPKHAKTLAHYFNNSGYETSYIGKWHLAENGLEKPGPVEKKYRGGYKHWLAADLLEFASDSYDTMLWNEENKPVKLPGYRVDALADASIRFIDRFQKKPFFLFTSYLEPHFQNHLDDYPPPDGYRERYAGRWMPADLAALGGTAHQHLGGYFGMVKRLDEAFGRTMDALKSLNLLENTIVLFTSDHGCHFKTRNGEYKRSCHESSIRVPTLFTGPTFQGGGQISELVSLIDLPPTLLESAGIPVPKTMQGRSIVPLLNGNKKKVNWPEEVFIQVVDNEVGRAIRTSRWKYGVVAPDKKGSKDSGSDQYVETYLYDLEADPHELTNVIGYESHQEVSSKLRQRLIRRMIEAGEKKPVIQSAPQKKSGHRRISIREA